MGDPNRLSRRDFIRLSAVTVGMVALSPLLKACQRGVDPATLAPTETQAPTITPTGTSAPTLTPADTPTRVINTATPAPKYTAERLGVRASRLEDIGASCRDPGTDFPGCRQDLSEAIDVIEKEVLPGLPDERFVVAGVNQFGVGQDRAKLLLGAPIRPVMTLKTPEDNVIIGFPVMGGDGRRTVMPAVSLPDSPWGDSDRMAHSVGAVLDYLGSNDNVPKDIPRASVTLGVIAAKSVGMNTPYAKKIEEAQAGTVDSLRVALGTWVIDRSHPLDVGIVRTSLLTVAGIQKK
jgi:hypothetical protein